MSTNKHFDKICCIILAFTLIITLLFVNSESFGVKILSKEAEYETKLFDTSKVHTIEIVMDNWDDFLNNCQSEEYYNCSVVIDNEAYKNVAIRGKGNTSLTQVASYGNNRYSFKIEFDHYDTSKNYYGLDKLCLNNIIQDNTYMKDYLTYQMMNKTEVASPLSSYVYITVNGEDWGLYLAVEGVEESFLERNYGKNYGELYKPDSQTMGGGRGNGEGFDIDNFLENNKNSSSNSDIQNEQNTSSETDKTLNIPQFDEKNTSNNAQSQFEQDNFFENFNKNNKQMPEMSGGQNGGNMQGGTIPPELPDNNMQNPTDFTQMPENITPPENSDDTEKNDFAQNNPDNNKTNEKSGNSSDDVLLKYIDDNVESYSNIFDNAKTKISSSDKKRLIKSLKKLSNNEDIESVVDVEKVIKYFVVHNFVLNFDSYTGSMIHNYYLYENDGQLQMIPWDYNLAFGGFQSMSGATTLVNYPIDSPVSGGNTEDRPMLSWIFENEEYTELYHKYFSQFIEEYFESGYFEEMIDKTISMISPYVSSDPTKFCTYDEFLKGSSTLKSFCLLRAKSIRGQLDGSIGSSSDNQETETLINADNIEISNMGSMNNGKGNEKNNISQNELNSQNNSSKNNGELENYDNTASEESDNISNFESDKIGNEMPQKDDSNNKPQRNNENFKQIGNEKSDNLSVILLAVSIIVLGLGIFFAFFFKR